MLEMKTTEMLRKEQTGVKVEVTFSVRLHQWQLSGNNGGSV